jgi:hypothetical protein
MFSNLLWYTRKQPCFYSLCASVLCLDMSCLCRHLPHRVQGACLSRACAGWQLCICWCMKP